MKSLLFLLLISTIVYPTGPSKLPGETNPPVEIALVSDSMDFKTHIQPIFEKRCNPCHFPGGKMYAKMPFDNPRTILDHEAGILRRIKDETELAQIKEFIRTNKPEGNEK